MSAFLPKTRRVTSVTAKFSTTSRVTPDSLPTEGAVSVCFIALMLRSLPAIV